MRPFSMISAVLALAVTTLRPVLAAQVFAGSNLYYAAGLNSDDRTKLLTALQSANMKVLRVWLDGQSDSQKGTNIDPFPSLEPNAIGTYDDTVLGRLDEFMVDAHNYGIKLLISVHSFNALQAGDVYGAQYGTGYFYEQDQPQQQFDARIVHVLNHVHSTLGKPWKELSEYIFAFEAQNEAMIGKGQEYIESHTAWQCDRATTIKNELGDSSGILVTTGGESWLDESVQDAWLSCPALDVIAVHAYGTGDFATDQVTTYADRIADAGKLMLFQEFGACYFSTSNNDCPTGDVLDVNTRNANIQSFTDGIAAAGVPWLYWQVIPNQDPHYGYDYEIGCTAEDDPSWETLQAAAQKASSYTARFDFSPYLL